MLLPIGVTTPAGAVIYCLLPIGNHDQGVGNARLFESPLEEKRVVFFVFRVKDGIEVHGRELHAAAISIQNVLP